MAMMLAYGHAPAARRAVCAYPWPILLVSLLATLTIFPLVFPYGMTPAAGTELVFDVLATVFAQMPGGRLFGTLFFLLLVLAALTPSVAGLEPLVAWLEQHRRLSRARAAIIAALCVWTLGVGSVLSFNLWSGWHPLGALSIFRTRRSRRDRLRLVEHPNSRRAPGHERAGRLAPQSQDRERGTGGRDTVASGSASGCCVTCARWPSPRLCVSAW